MHVEATPRAHAVLELAGTTQSRYEAEARCDELRAVAALRTRYPRAQ